MALRTYIQEQQEDIMSRLRTLSILALAVVFAGCGASVNPVMQKRVVEWFGKTSSQSYDASGAFTQVMPYAVGQYVVHGVTDGDDRADLRTAIVGKEDGYWIVETSSLTPSGENIMQMAVSGMEEAQKNMDPDAIDLKWIKMKSPDSDEIQKIDGMVLSMSKSAYRKGLTGLVIKMDGGSGTAAVRVPAGTFNGCTKVKSRVETFIADYESEGYHHPSVPLNGMVRSVSLDDGTTTDLLEFGTSGAKRSF